MLFSALFNVVGTAPVAAFAADRKPGDYPLGADSLVQSILRWLWAR